VALLTQLRGLQASTADDTAAVSTYVQQRSAFVRVLEALVESGSQEQLLTPQQLLASGAAAGGGIAALGGAGSAAAPAPAALAVSDALAGQLAVGLPTLQDQAFTQLSDLLFTENAVAADLRAQAAAAAAAARAEGDSDDGAAAADSERTASAGAHTVTAAAAAAAAAGANGFGRLQLSGTAAWERLWRYATQLLQREGPEGFDDAAAAAGGGGTAADAAEDDAVAGAGGADDDPDEEFEDWDAEGEAFAVCGCGCVCVCRVVGSRVRRGSARGGCGICAAPPQHTPHSTHHTTTQPQPVHHHHTHTHTHTTHTQLPPHGGPRAPRCAATRSLLLPRR
jgi:hypothetical protein